MRELPTLALVVAIAVRRALASLVVDDQARRICIKWPNDVVLVGETFPQTTAPSIKSLYSKLAGISSEVHAGGICVGIGVNVEPPEDAMEVGGKNAPAYLADLGFGFTCEREAAINAVGDAVLHEFEPLYRRWCDGGFAALSGEFAEHSMLEGRFVRMANQLGRSFARVRCAESMRPGGCSSDWKTVRRKPSPRARCICFSELERHGARRVGRGPRRTSQHAWPAMQSAACVALGARPSMSGLLRVLSLPISPSACRRFRAVGVINCSFLCADMHTIICFRKWQMRRLKHEVCI